jgi:nitrate reductase assembly molybdenum cofactor insertion protein NarJ
MLEAIADRLEHLRDTYAATLDEDAAAEYTSAFDRAARRRHPRVRLV